MPKFEVSTYYAFDGSFNQDDIAEKAVGRERDESGCGCGERDLGWICKSKSEADRIKIALETIGMPAIVMRVAP